MPASSPISALIDVNFILINRIAVLTITLLFFCITAVVTRSKEHELPQNIKAPIKLSLLGFLLLYAESTLSSFPRYQELFAAFQTIIVLLCLAKLVIYVSVDIYLRLHLKREVPSFIRDSVRLLIYLAVGIVSLRLVFKIDLAAIVTTTTVITATIAFAMQNTLSNALSGFSIQTDSLLARQNWISIIGQNIFGEIVNVGFRYTTLRNPEGNLIMVPNSVIMQNVVTFHGNLEYEDKPAVTLQISLGYDMPPETAKELLTQLMLDETLILSTPAPLVRLFAYNDSSITYQLKFWIAEPVQKVAVQDAIYSKAWYAVHRAGHSFPFPHRQIISTEEKIPFSFTREQIVKELAESDLFSMLDKEKILFLASQIPVRVFGTGEIVVRQNESGSSLFLVLKGELLVSVDERNVGIINEESFFGEMSLLTGAPRSATVIAKSEVYLAEITKEIMEPILASNPPLLERLSQVLAQRSLLTSISASDHENEAVIESKRVDYLNKLKNFFRL